MPSADVPLIRPMAQTGPSLRPELSPESIRPRWFTPFPGMCYITRRSTQDPAKARPSRSEPDPMSAPKSEFLKVILERGYLHQCTDWEALDALMAKQSISAYLGFDATADSLHVGSRVQIMLLRRLQQTGHRPIALMGGGTTKVGDPSGKDESRKLLTVDDINRNLDGIKQTFTGYLT